MEHTRKTIKFNELTVVAQARVLDNFGLREPTPELYNMEVMTVDYYDGEVGGFSYTKIL